MKRVFKMIKVKVNIIKCLNISYIISSKNEKCKILKYKNVIIILVITAIILLLITVLLLVLIQKVWI